MRQDEAGETGTAQNVKILIDRVKDVDLSREQWEAFKRL